MVNEFIGQRQLTVMLGVGVFLLSGCAPSGGLTLEASDGGREVRLREGKTLTVSLPGNPSTGYTWEVVDLDERILRQLGEPEFTTESDVPGAPGVQTLRFRAVGEGRTVLNLVHHRPWEEAEPERDFSVGVLVR